MITGILLMHKRLPRLALLVALLTANHLVAQFATLKELATAAFVGSSNLKNPVPADLEAVIKDHLDRKFGELYLQVFSKILPEKSIYTLLWSPDDKFIVSETYPAQELYFWDLILTLSLGILDSQRLPRRLLRFCYQRKSNRSHGLSTSFTSGLSSPRL